MNVFITLLSGTSHSKSYKKVLLREHKRHTDRGVSSTTRGGVPPSQVQWGVPEVGYPSSGYPQPGLTGGIPEVGNPLPIGVPHPARSDGGVPEVGYLPVGVSPGQV